MGNVVESILFVPTTLVHSVVLRELIHDAKDCPSHGTDPGVHSSANLDRNGGTGQAEEELKAARERTRLKAEQKSDTVAASAAGAVVGLVAGGLGDGFFAAGDAPWASPVTAVALGGATYAAATQVGRCYEDVRRRLLDQRICFPCAVLGSDSYSCSVTHCLSPRGALDLCCLASFMLEYDHWFGAVAGSYRKSI